MAGAPKVVQHYNDDWRGWPVRPHHEQHPVRGAFLDPRPDKQVGATFHNGVDVAVRDDRPEPGAPARRTHQEYAIEGGRVEAASAPGVRGLVDVAHFRYEHVDARVHVGQAIEPGQPIGWTCDGTWHVHLGERAVDADGVRRWVNALRPGGKVRPFVDRAKPEVKEIRYYTPATPAWGRRIGHVVRLPQAGRRLHKSRPARVGGGRARGHGPPAFLRWVRGLPWVPPPPPPLFASPSPPPPCGRRGR